MEKVIEKIKTDRIKEINAKEAIELLDKWRVQSVKSNAKENENAFEAKFDPFHPQNFSSWLSKQTGKKYDTLHSVASILTTFAVLELANNFLELGMDRRFERSNIHILDVLTLLIAGVVGEVSFYCARGKPHCGSKSMDQMRKEVASFKVIVNFKL